MGNPLRHIGLSLTLTLALLCLLPTLAYCWLVAGTPNIEVAEARRWLEQGKARAVFVEPLGIDSVAPFADVIHIPYSVLLSGKAPALDNSRSAEARSLLLFSRGGIKSALVTRRLSALGIHNIYSVRGGMQEWVRQGGAISSSTLKSRGMRPEESWPRFRPASPFEQASLLFSFFGVKTLYTLIASLLLFLLWSRKSARTSAIVRALGCFLIGETACFVNVLFFAEGSVPLEHIHGMFMTGSIGFACYGALSLLPTAREKGGNPLACPLRDLCRTCQQSAANACKFTRLYRLLLPGLATLALLPLSVSLRDDAYPVLLLGHLHGYGHPVVHQLFELRYLPIVAAALLLLAGLTQIGHSPQVKQSAQILAATGFGAMGFSFLRMMLFVPYAQDQQWFAFWEEWTELLYIGGFAATLWLFRPEFFADIGKTR